MKRIVVIGSGFAGLAAASVLAQHGQAVTVLEKNETLGGRARSFRAQGFTFDMGPSWYWMPDVFEAYFNLFGKKVSDLYTLEQLRPSYSIFFGQDDVLNIPAETEQLHELFESIEPGSSKALTKFLDEAAYKYEVGMKYLVYKPGRSLLEFTNRRFLKGVFRLHVFESLHRYVRKYFRDIRLIRLMEFPVLFLGGMPRNMPALYSLMNHASLSLGTWYPMGGINKIVEAMTAIAKSLGVEFITNTAVNEIEVRNSTAMGVKSNGHYFEAEVVIGGADYHHIEQELLAPAYRTYDRRYWDTRVMAPSSLIFYLGVNTRLNNLQHHNLFFDEDLGLHAQEIYEHPKWPSRPLFYVCCPSKTDETIAPQGCENIFILIPIASGLKDSESMREEYFEIVMNRLERLVGQQIKQHVVYKRGYCIDDFKKDYHAFKGNAYGLANTLRQTAIFKPLMRSKKVSNLFYTGQLTVPGPGVPPSLISGQVVANEVLKTIK